MNIRRKAVRNLFGDPEFLDQNRGPVRGPDRMPLDGTVRSRDQTFTEGNGVSSGGPVLPDVQGVVEVAVVAGAFMVAVESSQRNADLFHAAGQALGSVSRIPQDIPATVIPLHRNSFRRMFGIRESRFPEWHRPPGQHGPIHEVAYTVNGGRHRPVGRTHCVRS